MTNVQRCYRAGDRSKTRQSIGDDRLLGVDQVCDLLGVERHTASAIMKESGYAIQMHRRVLILESSLLRYLHKLEAQNG